MKIAQLKLLFDEGVVTDAKIVPSITSGYWVEVRLKKRWVSIDRRRDEDGVAHYSTIDAAYSAIISIGFKDQGLKLSHFEK